jgi:hypothetical protein
MHDTCNLVRRREYFIEARGGLYWSFKSGAKRPAWTTASSIIRLSPYRGLVRSAGAHRPTHETTLIASQLYKTDHASSRSPILPQ